MWTSLRASKIKATSSWIRTTPARQNSSSLLVIRDSEPSDRFTTREPKGWTRRKQPTTLEDSGRHRIVGRKCRRRYAGDEQRPCMRAGHVATTDLVIHPSPPRKQPARTGENQTPPPRGRASEHRARAGPEPYATEATAGGPKIIGA